MHLEDSLEEAPRRSVFIDQIQAGGSIGSPMPIVASAASMGANAFWQGPTTPTTPTPGSGWQWLLRQRGADTGVRTTSAPTRAASTSLAATGITTAPLIAITVPIVGIARRIVATGTGSHRRRQLEFAPPAFDIGLNRRRPLGRQPLSRPLGLARDGVRRHGTRLLPGRGGRGLPFFAAVRTTGPPATTATIASGSGTGFRVGGFSHLSRFLDDPFFLKHDIRLGDDFFACHARPDQQ
jgi:hypothetical protein